MRNTVLIMSVLLLAGCGSSEPAKTTEKGNGGVIPQHQLDALQKAEDMSSVLQQSEQKRREQTE
jgi:uncharacterized protein YcfL